ncbi:unnamed protein product, partial [Didymodactylos carnosus]
RCVEDGLDGVPGENGQVGGNGGNICFVTNKYFREQENIEKLITSGGEDDKGGNGGHGGNGHDGKNGDPKGELGIPGGDRGDAGLGGFGGRAGEVHIEENRKIIHDNCELVDKIESIDKSNRSAEHGKPGEDGKGGVGGYDGVDESAQQYLSFCQDNSSEEEKPLYGDAHVNYLSIKTTGNGNCLFNSIATLANMTDSFAIELRVRCIIELTLETAYYVQKYTNLFLIDEVDDDGFQQYIPGEENSLPQYIVNDLIRDTCWSDRWDIFAI